MKNENIESEYHYLYIDLIPLNSNVIVLTTTKKGKQNADPSLSN